MAYGPGGIAVGKRRTVSQYRAVDLTLFAMMLFFFESIIIFATNRWFPQEPYTVSVVPALTAIVLIRWGTWAGIHAFLGGLVLCIFSGAGLPQYVIYCVGNLFSLFSVLTFKAFGGKQGISASSLKTLLFGLEVLLLMQIGRALISLLFGNSLLTAAGFLTTEAVTDLFTLVILWIVRRLDGLLEDQYHYLLRLQEEERSNT